MDELQRLRGEIDAIDRELVEKWYGGSHGGFHDLYVVEIGSVYAE